MSTGATGDDKFVAPPSFDDVYRDHFAYVWNSLRRLGTEPPDLAETTHDVFLVVQKQLPTFDWNRLLKPWLFAIAVRVAFDRVTRPAIRPTEMGAAFDAKQSDASDDEKTRERLIRALRAVDRDRRAVVILHDIDEVSVEDVAHALGVPVKTVETRLRIGREELAKAFVNDDRKD
jgi:RNA polymerase sigma-70 factor (ECF subfamily)